jgi:hypothetical protein
MNIKTKGAIATAGLLALGGSGFGISLGSGVASAASTPTPISPSSKPGPPDVIKRGDPAPASQSGQQSGSDRATAEGSDGTSSEMSASETGHAIGWPRWSSGPWWHR